MNRKQRRANASAQVKQVHKDTPSKNAFGLDSESLLLKEPSVQRFLWALQGVADGTKKLVIESKASIRQVEKQTKTYAGAYSGEDKFVTDYTHTFRLEDINVTITEGPKGPIPEGANLRPGLDTLLRNSMQTPTEDNNKEGEVGSPQAEDATEEDQQDDSNLDNAKGNGESE